MIPIVIILHYSALPHNHLLAAGLFAIASLTDWLDGYLARKLNPHSPGADDADGLGRL